MRTLAVAALALALAPGAGAGQGRRTLHRCGASMQGWDRWLESPPVS